jgi:hypothetical protein
MAAREHRRENLLDHVGLANYDAAQLLNHLRARLAELSEVFADPIRGHRTGPLELGDDKFPYCRRSVSTGPASCNGPVAAPDAPDRSPHGWTYVARAAPCRCNARAGFADTGPVTLFRRRRRLLLELLEDRAVPANVTASVRQGILTVTGTTGPDVINVRQTPGVVSIDGVGSFAASGLTHVVVNAQAGDDTVSLTGTGIPATVFGGDGNDTLIGSNGSERLFGENGNDRLTGNAGNDWLVGGNGNDTLDAGAGNDRLLGDYGDDWLNGGTGDDVLFAGAGRDTMYGGDGFDRYQDDYVPPATAADVARSISARQGAETVDALPNDVDQALGFTCSFMSALASVARNRSDVASRISYDRTANQFRVPMFVNDHAVSVAVNFNGSWTDNDPSPGPAAADGRRDYWTLIYQRAFLQALNVDTSSSDATRWAVRGTTANQVTLQNWRYPAIALETLTGKPATIDTALTDSDKQLLEAALHGGKDVIANTWTTPEHQVETQSAGLVYSHSYTVVNVGTDNSGGFVVLRNPWGVDAPSGATDSWSTSDRVAFTLGNASDGYVKIRWDTFKQLFPTVVAA